MKLSKQSLQFQCCRHTYLFTFRVGFLLLCLFFVALFCFLGNWQLHRYHVKKNLVLTYQQRLKAPPQSFQALSTIETNQLQFQPVSVTGTYLNHLTVLIQNQMHSGQLGFEVLTPLKMIVGATGRSPDTKLLLIDRGWIPAPKNHSLPVIDPVKGINKLSGYIKLNQYHFILGKNNLNAKTTPIILQKIDIDELSQMTQQTFYPFIVRLDPSAAHGFVRDWVISAVLPERHLGYAIQWFLMAIVLAIAYFCFAIERVKESEGGR